MAFRKLDRITHTKVEMIQHFLRHFPEGTCEELCERYGNDEGFIKDTQFYKVRKRMRLAGASVGGVSKNAAEQDVPSPRPSWDDEDAKRSLSKPKPKKNGTPDKKYAALQAEVDYLRWLLDGERKGFLDQWLKEQG